MKTNFEMHPTGAVKKLDANGRIVLPAGIREKYGINVEDSIEILDGGDGRIILRKYEPAGACMLCHSIGDTVDFNGSRVCRKCISELAKRAESSGEE